MKLSNRSLLVMFLIAVLILLAACGEDGAETDDGEAGSDSDEDTIKIGVIADLSGPGAPLGPATFNAAELAVAKINEEGGVLGKEVELLTGDSASDSQVANEQAQMMYEKNGVEALFLQSNSANRESVMPVVEEVNKLFFYTPVYEGGSFHENTYYSGDVPPQQIEPVIPYLIEEYDAKKWYIVANDYIWGTETSEILKEILEEEGAELVGEDYTPIGTTEFTSIISKIKDEQPDFVSVQMLGADTVSFVKQLESLGVHEDVTLYSYLNDPDSVKAMGQGAEGMLQAASYFHTIDTPANNEYMEEYFKMFGDDANTPNFITNSPYEVIHIWAEAVNEAGSLETEDINEVITDISFDGPKGTVKFDPDSHHAELPIYLGEVQSDLEFKVIKDFGVYPPQQ